MGLTNNLKTSINKAKETLNNRISGNMLFDASGFNDPLALKTEWTPAKFGGTNFGTHTLKRTSQSRIQFKVRIIAMLFPIAFMIIGLSVIVGFTISGLNKNDTKMLLFGIPFGSIFFLVGCGILYSWMKPKVFDKSLGYYWKGRTEPSHDNIDAIKDCCRLIDIHAIQLISEYCRGDKSRFYSYEINIVFKDTKRLHIMDHGKLKLIRKDAKMLSEFLMVPLWDAI